MDRADAQIGILEALAVTAELTGTQLSEAAVKVMCMDLQAYAPEQVMGALTRCRRELKGRLTLAAILELLDDGRPGADEAWAMIPQDEASSCVWTTEMSQAWGIAVPLIEQGDKVGARMAFKDAYTRIVGKAKAEAVPVRWTPSLGHDAQGREAVIEDAVRRNRLTHEHAQKLLPHREQVHRNLTQPTAVGAILKLLQKA